ncbi:MAG: hypothetical protein GY780_00020 [bacterium]|nr:hypothetical protein [bacterium]
MIRFVENGARTKKPEDLSVLEKVQVAVSGVTVLRPVVEQHPSDFGLDAKQVRIPKGNGSELSAWVVDLDSPGPIVLLFHGYAECKDSMLPTAEGLVGLGCSTVLVDFYGGGDSGGNGTSIGYFEAEDVAASFSYAKANWPGAEIVLYGFSMGGAAVLRSVSHEKVSPDGIILESVFDSLENTTKQRFKSFGLPSWPLSDLLLFWGGRAWGFDTKSHNPMDYAKSVKCPTLVFHGSRDERISASQARSVFLGISGEKRFVTIEGLGHEHADPVVTELWANEVENFLERNR